MEGEVPDGISQTKNLYTPYIYHIIVIYIVNAMINISESANQILNIVKARYNLKDKSEAIEHVALSYGEDFLEPNLRPEFIEKMKARQLEPTVKIKDFRKHFGMK